MKLTNGAQVLAATGRDGNNNLYPLAFGVVGKEDGPNWIWFLEMLKMTIGDGQEYGGWTIMSDRQKVYMFITNNELSNYFLLILILHKNCTGFAEGNQQSIP